MRKCARSFLSSSRRCLKGEGKKDRDETLREMGIEKVREGLTTPEEVLRVTQEAEEF